MVCWYNLTLKEGLNDKPAPSSQVCFYKWKCKGVRLKVMRFIWCIRICEADEPEVHNKMARYNSFPHPASVVMEDHVMLHRCA